MAGNQPPRRFRAPLIDIKAVPDSHHEGEEQQRNPDTGNRQNAAALVAGTRSS